MMKTRIRAVFLDIDDTLLDYGAYSWEAVRCGAERFQLNVSGAELYAAFDAVNAELWHALEDGKLDFETLKQIRWNLIFQKLGIDFDGGRFERYFRECLSESAIPVASAPKLLEYLHGKYILCAASNGPYTQQRKRLALAGMERYMEYLFISEDLGAAKPERAFFDEAFARLNKGREPPVLPGEAVMLGDALASDIRGGIAARMHTIWLNRKDEKNNTGIVPEYTVRSLSEVWALL